MVGVLRPVVDGFQFRFQFLIGREIALQRARPWQFVARMDVFDQPLGISLRQAVKRQQYRISVQNKPIPQRVCPPTAVVEVGAQIRRRFDLPAEMQMLRFGQDQRQVRQVGVEPLGILPKPDPGRGQLIHQCPVDRRGR